MAERGRPKSAAPADAVTSVRLTKDDLKLVSEAARLTDTKPAAYMRAKILTAARRDLRRARQRAAEDTGE